MAAAAVEKERVDKMFDSASIGFKAEQARLNDLLQQSARLFRTCIGAHRVHCVPLRVCAHLEQTPYLGTTGWGWRDELQHLSQ